MTHPRPGRTLPATLCLLLLSAALPGAASAALPAVPEGFEVRLVAAVPAVQFPCQVATAPGGVLFVAEDPMDQVGPADRPIDRVLVFRDGEEPVVFAEKLNAVFGMVWHDGALYVMNMPNLTVLRDTDGDGKADDRKELFTDLGVPAGQPNNFNDHIVSGLQIGIDGYLYIAVGDKGVPRATGPDGRTAQVAGGGTLRCRPDGTGLEVYSSGTRNHLEPNLDARGNLFTYDNTDDGLGWWTRVTHHVDGGYYGYPWDYHDRTDRMLGRMDEYGGGSPCGGLVYKEDAWPERYRGRAFWAEWAKRNVRAFAFEPAGASFKVADVEDFVRPAEVSDFRPLDLALSYDGKTMYVADWGYGGWANKTEKLGRVYAITYTGETRQEPRGKDSDPVADQIKALAHPSYNERFRAQSALIRTGMAALNPVLAAAGDPGTEPVARRHIVWVVDGITRSGPVRAGQARVDGRDLIGALALQLLALTDPDGDVRAQAVRALGHRAEKATAGTVRHVLGSNSDPAVRLQAVIALGRIGDPASVPDLIPLVADADPFIAFSARTALKRVGDWTGASAGLDSTDPKVRAGVMLAAEMVWDADAASALARFAADPGRDAGERARALFLLAQGHRKPVPWDGTWWGTQPARRPRPAKSVDWEGTPLVLATVRGLLADPSVPVRLEAVTAARQTADPEALPALRARFADETEAAVKAALAATLGALRDDESVPLLTAALRDPGTPDAVRDAALGGVVAVGSGTARKTLLGLLESDALGPERRPRLIASLGAFKAPDVVAALVKAVESPAEAVRAAAAEALGKAGDAAHAAGPLRGRLADPAVAVRKAAIAALGALKDGSSVPALVEAAGHAETRFEASLALTSVPDARALGVYLQGLADRSPELRKASSNAVNAIRDEAAPVLERLAARKELPSTALPELRKVYTKMRPVRSWELLGPVPIGTDPPFPVDDKVDLKATYPGFQDEPLAWKTARSRDGKGMIDLNRALRPGDEVAAFAYAEVESPADRKATFAAGSDDTLTVWVNGEKVYDFQDSRSYNAEGAQFDAPLAKGTNRVVVKCGNRDGGWQFSLAVAYPSDYGFLQGPAPGAFDAEAFRKFARSARGAAEKGRALFGDLKGLACVKCHAVGGQGGAVGPELTSVGAKYPKDELITAVLYPSAKISSGYEPVVVALTDGRVVTGIVKGETPDAVDVEDADAKRHRIPRSEIDERKQSDVSLMPNGLAEGLSAQDFADLIAYLETLKDKDVNPPKPAAGAGGGR